MFCEGGGILVVLLLYVNLVDELIVFLVGMVIGVEGMFGLVMMGIDCLVEVLCFELIEVKILGLDVMMCWCVGV